MIEPTVQPSSRGNPAAIPSHDVTDLGTPPELASLADHQRISGCVDDAQPIVRDTEPCVSPNSPITDRAEADGHRGSDHIQSPKTSHKETDNHQGDDHITDDPGPVVPSPKSNHATSVSGRPHRHVPITIPPPVVDNTVQAATPNATIQSTTSNEPKVMEHLSQKRPAEDPNHSAKHDAKRTKLVQPPEVLSSLNGALKEKQRGKLPAHHTTNGRPRGGHGVPIKHPKKPIQAQKRAAAGTRGPRALLSQRVEDDDHDDDDTNDNSDGDRNDNNDNKMEADQEEEEMEIDQDGDEDSPSSRGTERGLDDTEESSGGEKESPGSVREGSGKGDDGKTGGRSRRIFDLSSSPQSHRSVAAVETPRNGKEEDDDGSPMESMRLIDETDLKYLSKPLLHRPQSLASQALALRSESARKRSSKMVQMQQEKGKKHSVTRQSPSQGASKQNIKDKQKAAAKREKVSVRQQAKKEGEDGGEDVESDPQGASEDKESDPRGAGENLESDPQGAGEDKETNRSEEEVRVVAEEAGSAGDVETAAEERASNFPPLTLWPCY